MQIVKLEGRSAVVEINESELLVLHASLNEVCNGIDVQAFDTRIGSSKEFAKVLLEKTNEILDELNQLKTIK